MTDQTTEHTPGAWRASDRIVAKIADQENRDAARHFVARIIDEETASPDLLNALDCAAFWIEQQAKDMSHPGLKESAEGQARFCRAAIAIAKRVK